MYGRRVFGLDVLRALAILIVVYAHGVIFQGNSHFLKKLYKIHIPIDGVDLFFVLSGFLIGHILLKAVSNGFFNISSLFEFWIRRWFRTLPNYFLILGCLMLIFNSYFDKYTIIKFIFFIQNLAYPHPDVFPEAWSLAVEEWFYLATPLLLFFLMKIKGLEHKRIILSWIFMIIIFSTAFRVYQAILMNLDGYAWEAHIRKEVFTRLDSLMYGILGAYLNRYHEKAWSAWANKCFALGIIMILGVLPAISAAISQKFFLNYISLTFYPISVLLLLPKLSAWNVGPGRIRNVIIFISKISYSMYLTHLSLIMFYVLPKVMGWMPFHLGRSEDLVRYIMYWTLTILISTILYKYYEQPMTSLRDKFSFRKLSIMPRPLTSST
ncbi:O-acetyltransferase OatA [Legionella massiliensis]|uniref:O-acetyltransferase OatA n=1 Tax=Legionella massiliensis TaxID=1034943 RepID=A0A078KPA7_9GAMM|nr:acyltransferase [Legionella massiliensis]CDZ76230.1 O-acetyltransferase OatA [Legionella massiliensis]CEE11968.1 O-acetyltransferase OatA [Legionella massiliensis]